jgi:hypothetical protein
MGRHSDPDPRWFWQSLAAAAAKAVLGLAVVGLVVMGVVRWTGSGEDDGGSQPVATPSSPATAAELAAEPALEEPPRGEATDEPDAPLDDDEDGGDDGPVLATVQVLNGSGDPDLLDEVVGILEDLGYEVVSTGRAARRYDETTVFWSAGHRDDAEDLRQADARFIAVEPNERLDRTIDLHVVIGADWDAGD